jgi:hypothetical protein
VEVKFQLLGSPVSAITLYPSIYVYVFHVLPFLSVSEGNTQLKYIEMYVEMSSCRSSGKVSSDDISRLALLSAGVLSDW